MPRVLITTDDGDVTLDERLQPHDFQSEHFRRCLADRLWWATEDAGRRGERAHAARRRGAPGRPRPAERV